MRQLPVLILAFALPALAQGPSHHPRWAVHVNNGLDFYIDQPSCHPLEYFLHDPQRFDYGSDLAGITVQPIEDAVQSKAIGDVAGYTIRQIIHDINHGEIVMKMILVESKGGEVCEIFHEQYPADAAAVKPAYLVTSGSERILATTDPLRGNDGEAVEDYWTFDEEGPIELDVIDQIMEIEHKLLPSDLRIRKGGGFDVRTLTYSMVAWKGEDANCCPTGGRIEINFALRDHRLVAVSQSIHSK
jgi:hypothetical protein